ncbi:MAG: bifunctional DNA-binding transcriptional regulator/O6-methylguanine-DNA methyltransferase Ada [Sphingomonadales bacterium]|nr:MAG: bifunctional DNA-binding transcriptional regulator/O6-methylguanine-DNA methyltransferase Ada [Sphingomonadales bacterium]TNF05966.1 MAG: bifunctional DNA-binding transcriptional regulator/O6-methylguanine-DNA methyltransferase Ada [Sphingomonadales bacterium]
MDHRMAGHGDGPEAEAAWDAFLRRDRAYDGQFVIAVRTTGIYCRPGCPARRPKRENVSIFADGAAARAGGFRPCLRCRPDDAARDRVAVERAVALIETGEGAPRLAELARAVGYAPHHFQRLFRRALGVSPAAYARQWRAGRLERALKEEERVTDAIYEAGFAASATAYADAAGRLGMTPGARKKGGAGEHIRFAIVGSSLGSMLVAATDKGLARISFDEDESDLRRHFPAAELVAGDAGFTELVARVVALVDDPARADMNLPVDMRGTAFQQAVWQALRAIPAGETRSYAEIAMAVGRPKAVRAAGSACGDNGLAVLIPCHRVLRSDGGLGGYAYGLARKRALLKRERG